MIWRNVHTNDFSENHYQSRLKESNNIHMKTETLDSLKKLAKEYYFANLEKNKYLSKAEQARKELYSKMKESNLDNFEFKVKKDSNSIKEHNLHVYIEQTQSNKVDILLLKDLVSEKVFMQIVSATQTAVKDYTCECTLQKCLIKKLGDENVHVTSE